MLGEHIQKARLFDGIYMNAGPTRFHIAHMDYAHNFDAPLTVAKRQLFHLALLWQIEGTGCDRR